MGYTHANRFYEHVMFNSLHISHSKRGASHYYLDASARYRCVFPCEEYKQNENKHCIHFDQIDSIDLKQYKLIIFHRPSISSKLKAVLKRIRQLNIKAVVDFDDLLFSPEFALENPTYLSGQMSAKQALKGANNYLKALLQFEYAQVSTAPLARHIKKAHPDCQVEVLANKIPQRWAKAAQQIDIKERLNNKIIRYFPGTSHHTSNFNSTIETLRSILNANQDISLEVIGDIQIPTGTFPTQQFKQLPHCLYEELPSIIASSWLTISPLEQNEFNQCKSGLKFWESGCFGVPVISNPIPDMERFTCEGLLLSNNHKDWIANINSMKDEHHYQQACNSALNLALTCVLKGTEQEPCDYESIQVLMCAEFGPSWPAIRINPTHPQFKDANLKYKSLTPLSPALIKNKARPKEVKYQSAEKIKEYLTSKKKNTAQRKFIKLKNNPRLFFSDMYKNIFNNP